MIFRKAKITDVLIIQKLINDYANEGKMLAKPLITIYENLREYVIGEEDGQVVAVGGLHILWEDLAEIRSLAVIKGHVGTGIGSEIVARLEKEAACLGIGQVFALTYQTKFFAKLGYVEIEHSALPQKVWMECINCPKFPNCDEHAVIKKTK